MIFINDLVVGGYFMMLGWIVVDVLLLDGLVVCKLMVSLNVINIIDKKVELMLVVG